MSAMTTKNVRGAEMKKVAKMTHVNMYGPLRFKTVGWAISQTWSVSCVTRIGLLHEFNPSGLKGLSHA